MRKTKSTETENREAINGHDITAIAEVLAGSSEEYRYQLLSRIKQDRDHYLGAENRQWKRHFLGPLSINSEAEQIAYMVALWNSFDEDRKPEWLTADDILDYEKRMLSEVTRLDDLIQTAESKVVVPHNSNAAKGAITHEL